MNEAGVITLLTNTGGTTDRLARKNSPDFVNKCPVGIKSLAYALSPTVGVASANTIFFDRNLEVAGQVRQAVKNLNQGRSGKNIDRFALIPISYTEINQDPLSELAETFLALEGRWQELLGNVNSPDEYRQFQTRVTMLFHSGLLKSHQWLNKLDLGKDSNLVRKYLTSQLEEAFSVLQSVGDSLPKVVACSSPSEIQIGDAFNHEGNRYLVLRKVKAKDQTKLVTLMLDQDGDFSIKELLFSSISNMPELLIERASVPAMFRSLYRAEKSLFRADSHELQEDLNQGDVLHVADGSSSLVLDQRGFDLLYLKFLVEGGGKIYKVWTL